MPSSGGSKVFNKLTEHDVGAFVRSIDWSYDDVFLAAGSSRIGSSSKLEIIKFDRTSLNPVSEIKLGKSIRTVRWHPLAHLLALGKTGAVGSDNLQLFSFDPEKNLLEKISGDDLGHKDVYAVSWHPSGTMLAVARNMPHSQIGIYRLDGDQLTEITDVGFRYHRHVRDDAMVWDPTGAYLAVGVHKSSWFPEVIVYHYDAQESLLTLTASIDLNGGVRTLDWSPTGSYIAVGLSDGIQNERLRLFRFNYENQNIEEVTTVCVGEKQLVHSVHWSNDGKHLTVGRIHDCQDAQIRIYEFDDSSETLQLLDEQEVIQDIYAVRMSHDGEYVITGDAKHRSLLYRVGDEFFFDNLKLSFNSDVSFQMPIRFQGISVLTGNGNQIHMQENSSVAINPASLATFQNAYFHFYGDGGASLLLHDSATLIFKDMALCAPTGLSALTGSIQFSGICNLVGSFIFDSLCCRSSSIILQGTTSINGTWLFEDTTSLHGNGQILDLSQGGILLVSSGSRLCVSDVVIKGLGNGLGGIELADATSQLCLSKVMLCLDSDMTTTMGQIIVNGPCSIMIKDNIWTVAQQAHVTVDGVTLCKDYAGAFPPGDLIFDDPVAHYCSLINSGTIKWFGGGYSTGYTYVVGSAQTPYDLVIANSEAIARHDMRLNTIDTGPNNLIVAGHSIRGDRSYPDPLILTYDLNLSPHHIMHFTSDCLLNGSTHTINFAYGAQNTFILDDNVTVTIEQTTLRNFSDKQVSLGVGSQLIFGDGTLIRLYADGALSRTWTLSGTVILDGQGHTLLFDSNGSFSLMHTNLHIKNVVLSGLSGQSFLCADDGTIIFDSTKLLVANDLQWNQGGFVVQDDVTLAGTGSFSYESCATSTINSHSRLIVAPGMTLRYAPACPDKTLLVMHDKTAQIVLDSSTLYATSTGLRLTSGTMVVKNRSCLQSGATHPGEGIEFGDGIAEHDLTLKIEPGAHLEQRGGYIEYRNVIT
jgi:WD40 repeat protein